MLLAWLVACDKFVNLRSLKIIISRVQNVQHAGLLYLLYNYSRAKDYRKDTQPYQKHCQTNSGVVKIINGWRVNINQTWVITVNDNK